MLQISIEEKPLTSPYLSKHVGEPSVDTKNAKDVKGPQKPNQCLVCPFWAIIETSQCNMGDPIKLPEFVDRKGSF